MGPALQVLDGEKAGDGATGNIRSLNVGENGGRKVWAGQGGGGRVESRGRDGRMVAVGAATPKARPNDARRISEHPVISDLTSFL